GGEAPVPRDRTRREGGTAAEQQEQEKGAQEGKLAPHAAGGKVGGGEHPPIPRPFTPAVASPA
ncbi:MAG: hypothetical protein KAF27_04885, partial [Porphyrobacter sp.]|nr:hypothetical protein [Porphyrobacter sp.]